MVGRHRSATKGDGNAQSGQTNGAAENSLGGQPINIAHNAPQGQIQDGMLQLMQTLIKVVQQQQEQQQQQMQQNGVVNGGPRSRIAEFKKLAPPSFEGSADLLKAEQQELQR